MRWGIVIIAGLALAGASGAQSLDGPRTWRDGGILVTEGDLTNCPYHEIGRIEANVHRNTIFGKKPSEAKVVREMRERADELGADAIVRAEISADHATMVWGSVITGSGRAVKFEGQCDRPEIIG